ncbi:MAG: hypothetical protein VKI63_06170 [Cyanobium sp.]|nr:hypothetical protein [Cyanobium sp.]
MTLTAQPTTNPLIEKLTSWRRDVQTLMGQGRQVQADEYIRAREREYPGFERLIRADAAQRVQDLTPTAERTAQGMIAVADQASEADARAFDRMAPRITNSRERDERLRIGRQVDWEDAATRIRRERSTDDTNQIGARLNLETQNQIGRVQGHVNALRPLVEMGYGHDRDVIGAVERTSQAAMGSNERMSGMYVDAARDLARPSTWENIASMGKLALLFGSLFT